MSTADLQNTSQMAIKLWTGRDAAYAGVQDSSPAANGRPRRNSFGSSYSHTVLGTGNRPGVVVPEVDHGVTCDGCAQVRVRLNWSVHVRMWTNGARAARHWCPLPMRELSVVPEAHQLGRFSCSSLVFAGG